MKKLTAKEEEIMNILWAEGPLFIREMLAFYPEPKPHYNTVATLVKLLAEKGFVSYRAFGNTYRYEAKITEMNTRVRRSGRLLPNILIILIPRLFLSLLKMRKWNLEELKQLIAQIEQEKNDRKS